MALKAKWTCWIAQDSAFIIDWTEFMVFKRWGRIAPWHARIFVTLSFVQTMLVGPDLLNSLAMISTIVAKNGSIDLAGTIVVSNGAMGN